MERDHHVIRGESRVDIDDIGPHCNSPYVREERVLGEHPVATTVRDHQRATRAQRVGAVVAHWVLAGGAAVWRPRRVGVAAPAHDNDCRDNDGRKHADCGEDGDHLVPASKPLHPAPPNTRRVNAER